MSVRNDARAASVALLAYEAKRPEQDLQLSVQDFIPIVRDVLVISGPCGAGKSTVGFECLELLEAGGVAAAMIDAELAYFHPKPDDDPQGTRVAEAALAAVAPVYAAAGIERLLLPRVIERPRHLELVHTALPDT